ncbi:MAG: TRC40/GET3/ArsA family transport-energizing ATPase, partial [Candidatus Brocadiae bacterium]|nr:TRC40/GET3/ArsA family transport-energizing ATPase [Candidatus Brocadiia bacterium]
MRSQQLSREAAQQQAVEEDASGRQPLPGFLCNPRLRLLFFGGKGGTGKTTSASSAALLLARAVPERQVLVMSTDPAHSLGDSLNQPVGPSIVPVRGAANLSAMEVDPPLLLEAFKHKHGKHLKKMAAGTVFSNQADIRDFLSFRLPGMEDLMVFASVAEYLQRGVPHDPLPPTRCDLIVMDTAPTGHTLRLLEMPQKSSRWVALFKRSFNKYYRTSAGLQSLGLFAIPGHERGAPGVPEFLNRLMEDIKFTGELLADRERCEFVMVTIPEEMGVAETVRLAGALDRQGIAARNVIVNCVRSNLNCPLCRSQAEGQQAYLKQIEEQFAAHRLVKVPLFAGEIRGQEALGGYGLALAGRDGSGHNALAPQSSTDPRMATSDSVSVRVELAELAKKRYLIFGGKGGVGKT